MRAIAISGKCGVGKTTFANHLIQLVGGTKISLGDGVKEECAEFLTTCLVSFEHRHLYGTQADRAEVFEVGIADWQQADYRARRVLAPHVESDGRSVAMTYRKLLQLWGTEYRRTQDPDYWVKKGREKALNTEGLVIFDDIRFPNEVDMAYDLGGFLIRVERPGGPFTTNSDHTSETALDNCKLFHMSVFNGGSLEDFKAEIESIARWLR